MATLNYKGRDYTIADDEAQRLERDIDALKAKALDGDAEEMI